MKTGTYAQVQLADSDDVEHGLIREINDRGFFFEADNGWSATFCWYDMDTNFVLLKSCPATCPLRPMPRANQGHGMGHMLSEQTKADILRRAA